MKNIKNILFVLIALTSSAFMLSSCSNEDKGNIRAIYEQTATFSSAAQTCVVDLNLMSGEARIQESSIGWATITAVPYSGSGNTQVEIKLEENTSESTRTALQVIKVGRYTVKLTINQGVTNITDPNEEVSDQPAYAPEK